MPPHLLGAAQFFETTQKIHASAKNPQKWIFAKIDLDPKIPKSGFLTVFGPIPETFRSGDPEKGLN